MEESKLRIKQLVLFNKPSAHFLSNDTRPMIWLSSIDAYDNNPATIISIYRNKSSNCIQCILEFDDGAEFLVYPEWISAIGTDENGPIKPKLTVDKVNELLYDVQRCVSQDRRRDLVDKFIKEVG